MLPARQEIELGRGIRLYCSEEEEMNLTEWFCSCAINVSYFYFIFMEIVIMKQVEFFLKKYYIWTAMLFISRPYNKVCVCFPLNKSNPLSHDGLCFMVCACVSVCVHTCTCVSVCMYYFFCP